MTDPPPPPPVPRWGEGILWRGLRYAQAERNETRGRDESRPYMKSTRTGDHGGSPLHRRRTPSPSPSPPVHTPSGGEGNEGLMITLGVGGELALFDFLAEAAEGLQGVGSQVGIGFDELGHELL